MSTQISDRIETTPPPRLFSQVDTLETTPAPPSVAQVGAGFARAYAASFGLSSPWLTLREADRYARVGNGTVRRAANSGELCAKTRAHGTTLVHMSEVDRWILSWNTQGGER